MVPSSPRPHMITHDHNRPVLTAVFPALVSTTSSCWWPQNTGAQGREAWSLLYAKKRRLVEKVKAALGLISEDGITKELLHQQSDLIEHAINKITAG